MAASSGMALSRFDLYWSHSLTHVAMADLGFRSNIMSINLSI